MTMTFGIRAKEQELDAVAEILAEIFEVKFDQRESSFRGGDYCWGGKPGRRTDPTAQPRASRRRALRVWMANRPIDLIYRRGG
jgi:hypothetical protein